MEFVLFEIEQIFIDLNDVRFIIEFDEVVSLFKMYSAMNQCTLKICPTFNVKSEIYDSIENQPTVFKRLRYKHMSRGAYADLQVLRPSYWPLQFSQNSAIAPIVMCAI